MLGEVLNRTFARGGVVVIPAFAVDRTQTLMYYMAQLKAARTIPPEVPVYLNSPMAVNVTRIFNQHHAEHRRASRASRAARHALEQAKVHVPLRLHFA